MSLTMLPCTSRPELQVWLCILIRAISIAHKHDVHSIYTGGSCTMHFRVLQDPVLDFVINPWTKISVQLSKPTPSVVLVSQNHFICYQNNFSQMGFWDRVISSMLATVGFSGSDWACECRYNQNKRMNQTSFEVSAQITADQATLRRILFT